MRLGNLRGRAVVLSPEMTRGFDLESSSSGRFGPDAMQALANWDAVRAFVAALDFSGAPEIDVAALGPCSPRPRAVFGIGLNYRDHAAEAGLPIPKEPLVFTKFPSCLVGPRSDVIVFGDRVDWEAELVVVIGKRAENVSEARALEFVAGYCCGQDVSDRKLQFASQPPQFSLGKSRATFGPIGPAIVTLDELATPLDLAITCDLDAERMQTSRTSQLIFGVPELLAYLSRHCELSPGDLIFTGTPGGVGSVRKRYLKPGETIRTQIEGVGTLVNRCVAPSA
jgi:2-keto-4-pentenoate hydratase/2-oxohepta-3-ene-1,7-dioic acid hydratase in catechol pathway